MASKTNFQMLVLYIDGYVMYADKHVMCTYKLVVYGAYGDGICREFIIVCLMQCLNKHYFRNLSRFGMTREVSQLMERIALCVQHNEPVLLVGETGVGKTAVVQFLAAHVGMTLRVVNLSQHSDSSDLIGG